MENGTTGQKEDRDQRDGTAYSSTALAHCITTVGGRAMQATVLSNSFSSTFCIHAVLVALITASKNRATQAAIQESS